MKKPIVMIRNASGTLMSLTLTVLFVLSVTVCGGSQAIAQSKTDFSGTWSLNESKSNFGEGGFRMGASSLSVTQQGNDLTVVRTMQGRDGQTRTSTEKYTLDGKESTNQAFGGTRRSVAKWSADGKTLTISSTTTMQREGQSMEMKSTDTWTLSDGGKTLSISSLSTTPRGERKATMVYDRK